MFRPLSIIRLGITSQEIYISTKNSLERMSSYFLRRGKNGGTIFQVRITLPSKEKWGGNTHFFPSYASRSAHRALVNLSIRRQTEASQNLIAAGIPDKSGGSEFSDRIDRSFLVIATGDSGFDVVQLLRRGN